MFFSVWEYVICFLLSLAISFVVACCFLITETEQTSDESTLGEWTENIQIQ